MYGYSNTPHLDDIAEEYLKHYQLPSYYCLQDPEEKAQYLQSTLEDVDPCEIQYAHIQDINHR